MRGNISVFRLPLVFLLLLMTGSYASADTYRFTLKDGTNVISFVLPASPTPGAFMIGTGFTISDVSVLVNGTPQIYGINFYDCASACSDLDLYIFAENPSYLSLIYQAGPILFTGSEAQPTFKLGKFELANEEQGLSCNVCSLSSDFDLTIKKVPEKAVPEPSSLALLIVGAAWLSILFVTRRLTLHLRF